MSDDAWTMAVKAAWACRPVRDEHWEKIDLVEALRAALSSLEESGWVLVPSEPTQDMCTAGLWVADRDQHTPHAMGQRYAAMLVARPTFPPKET